MVHAGVIAPVCHWQERCPGTESSLLSGSGSMTAISVVCVCAEGPMKVLGTMAVALGIMLGGCTTYAVPDPSPNHPASAEARAAPAPVPSDTLAIDAANLPKTPAELSGVAPASHAGQAAASAQATVPPAGETAHETPAVAPPAEPSDGHTTYTCPMHPEVVADRPGSCPKCGMRLVPRKAPSP